MTTIPNPFETLGLPNPFRSLALLPTVDFGTSTEAPNAAGPVVILPRRKSIREIVSQYDERGRLVG